jgi:hypothetical protein
LAKNGTFIRITDEIKTLQSNLKMLEEEMSVVIPYEPLQTQDVSNCVFLENGKAPKDKAKIIRLLNEKKIKKANLLILDCINILLGLFKLNLYILAAKTTDKFYLMKKYYINNTKKQPKRGKETFIPYVAVVKLNDWGVTCAWQKTEDNKKYDYRQKDEKKKNPFSRYLRLSGDGLSYAKTEFNDNPDVKPFVILCENEFYQVREMSTFLLQAHKTLEMLKQRTIKPKIKYKPKEEKTEKSETESSETQEQSETSETAETRNPQ